MMDFLRALAPRRDRDASLAVAVVPSRFAAERPMTAPPIVAPAIESGPTTENRVLPVVPSPWHVERRAERRQAPISGAPIVVTPPVAEAPREREPADDSSRAAPKEPRSDDTNGPLRPIRPSLADIRLPVAGLGRLEPPEREPRDKAAATVAPVPAATVPQARRLTTVVAMPPATAVRAPMSPAFLAARVTPPADRPPVIEVTIDRLEVRAPAPAELAPSATRRRAASPSVPLADYLRGKTGQSGGAA
jgi:hypothetical protein